MSLIPLPTTLAGRIHRMFYLRNREFSMTVGVSNPPCGTNGAVFITNMPKDGGRSQGEPNGAAYGTGMVTDPSPVLSSLDPTTHQSHGLLRRAMSQDRVPPQLAAVQQLYGLLLRGNGYMGSQQGHHRIYSAPLRQPYIMVPASKKRRRICLRYPRLGSASPSP